MSGFVNLNGELIPKDRALFTGTNRAFKYADALFESFRVVNGFAPFLGEHLDRLLKGMEMTGLYCPHIANIAFMHKEVYRLVHRSRLMSGARIRLTVFREGGGTYFPKTDNASWLMEVSPLNATFELNDKGYCLGIFDSYTKPMHPFNALKSANAQLFVQAAREAVRTEKDEVLILNERGRVCEGVSSNVFFVVKEQVITPALSEGPLPGVMRDFVIKLLAKGGVKVVESSVTPEVLHEAGEVFFTNSTKGVQWAMAYDTKRYYHKLSSQLVMALNKEVELRLSLNSDFPESES